MKQTAIETFCQPFLVYLFRKYSVFVFLVKFCMLNGKTEPLAIENALVNTHNKP